MTFIFILQVLGFFLFLFCSRSVKNTTDAVVLQSGRLILHGLNNIPLIIPLVYAEDLSIFSPNPRSISFPVLLLITTNTVDFFLIEIKLK